jgi:hypothetical protein
MLAMGACIGIAVLLPLGFFGVVDIGQLIGLEIVEALAVSCSVFLARRWLDKRSITSLGLKTNRQALLDMLAGFLIAGLMMGLIYLLEWSLGWLHFEGYAWESEPPSGVPFNVANILLFFIIVAWSEELLTRGYHLQTIASGLNTFWGVAISSVIFGCLHLLNPNATWISAVGIFLAGFFLAYGYLRTGQLWLPIGLHIGWNFFEGAVFGFPVSGMEFYRLVRHTISGPELWTGGAFGPEAGLAIVPALLVGAVLVYLYTFMQKSVL